MSLLLFNQESTSKSLELKLVLYLYAFTASHKSRQVIKDGELAWGCIGCASTRYTSKSGVTSTLVLLCVEVGARHRMQALLVLNPVTKEYKEIPHFHWSTHKLVVDNNTNDYKLYAINKKLGLQDCELVVEVYDSNDGVWRALCVIPSLRDCTTLTSPSIMLMAVYGDFVHVLLKFDDLFRDRIFFLQESTCKVVIYSISEDSWHCPTNTVGTRAALPEFVRHAPFEKFMTLPFSLWFWSQIFNDEWGLTNPFRYILFIFLWSSES